jgi:serine/threonine protein kinase
MGLVAGEKLDPYEILSLIGKGGMGEVYWARDPRLSRDVAIKVSAVPVQNGSNVKRAQSGRSIIRIFVRSMTSVRIISCWSKLPCRPALSADYLDLQLGSPFEESDAITR